MDIYIAGAAVSKFGELWDKSPRMLAGDVVSRALADASLSTKDVQSFYVANMLSGILGGQGHLGALFSEELGFAHIPAYTVEGACASGGLAVHTAVSSLLSGKCETVVVLGIEKMTDHKPEFVTTALMAAGTSEERLAGATFPGLYGLLARAHMEKFGTTQTQLASVAVKNHYHASLNPYAQFQSLLTIEQVLTSGLVADPLHLFDCSPISDGAAALVLTSRPLKGKACIIASEVATDTLGVARRADMTELVATSTAAKRAYKNARITSKDIQVAEVHDCFTIAEILAIEDLGFFPKGKAASAVERGDVTVGTAKHIAVNTSGGLKGCGHPVGATGVKQIVELRDQLEYRAGKRQVEDVRFGLAQNVGGSGATCVVHILQKT